MTTAIESLKSHLTRPRGRIGIAVDCLVFGLFLVGLAYLMFKAFQVSGRHAGYDFKYIWLAGECWRHGVNPYTAEYYALGKQLIATGHVPNLWVYPPNWFLPSVLFALANLKPAWVLWSFLNIAILVAASALLTVALPLQWPDSTPCDAPFDVAWRHLGAPWNLFFLHVWAIAVLQPTALGLSVGQTSILVYFGTSLLLYGLAKDLPLASVLGLSIALLKPQVGAVICLALIMIPAHRLIVAKAVAVSVAISLPAFILAPTTGLDFLSSVTQYDNVASANSPQSTTGFRHLLWTVSGLDLGNVVFMLAAILLTAGLLLTLNRDRIAVRGAGFVILATAITMAVAPLHLYDLILAGILLFTLARARGLAMGFGCLGVALLWRADDVANLIGFFGEGTEHFEGTRLATLGAVSMLIAVFQTERRSSVRARA